MVLPMFSIMHFYTFWSQLLLNGENLHWLRFTFSQVKTKDLSARTCPLLRLLKFADPMTSLVETGTAYQFPRCAMASETVSLAKTKGISATPLYPCRPLNPFAPRTSLCARVTSLVSTTSVSATMFAIVLGVRSV